VGLKGAEKEQSNARETTELAPVPSFTTVGSLAVYGLTGRLWYTFSPLDVPTRDLPCEPG
jgi:hypothetical protein